MQFSEIVARQADGWFIFKGHIPALIAFVIYLIAGNAEAVSYTHLDVYKRQVRGFLSVMSVSFRLVSIDSLKKGRDSGATPASQSEHLCRTNVNLSDNCLLYTSRCV